MVVGKVHPVIVLGVGNWAYVVVGVAVPLFGFLGLWIDGRRRIERVHDEVRSPNGTRTGDLAYETAKRVIEVREQMVEIRETQLQIQRVVNDHDQRDEERFSAIEERLDGLTSRLGDVDGLAP